MTHNSEQIHEVNSVTVHALMWMVQQLETCSWCG